MEGLTLNNFRTLKFDIFFILVIPIIAAITAFFVSYSPEYFDLVLRLDLALLGYHHVISTYTRFSAIDIEKKERNFIVFILPIIVITSVYTGIVLGGVIFITTTYLHWQWWHYTRQSEGISKAIKFKTKSKMYGKEVFNRFLFYLTPISSFLVMSSGKPSLFLAMPVATLPVPVAFAKLAFYINLLLLLFWLLVQLKQLKIGHLKWQEFLYLVSHHCIYIISYVFIQDISVGWLAINIWHNLQYITFVWHFNSNQHSKNIRNVKRLMYWLCKPSPLYIFFYMATCFLLSKLFYNSINTIVVYLHTFTTLPLFMIAYQSINFHHYITDTMIWKMRKKSVRKTLDIQ